MKWLGLAALPKKDYSFLLLNEFYSRLLIHANEYENPVRFRNDSLYMFFDGEEHVISQEDLGKLIDCEDYDGPYEASYHYPSDNVWDTFATHAGSKKVASNLKSLPLIFLHHFITSNVQYRTGSFTKVTTHDIWLLEMETIGTKINVSRFIMNKMIKVLKEKDKEAKSRRKTSQQSQFRVPYVTLITHYAKTLGTLNLRYEFLPIAVTYNLALMAKMGCKDNNHIDIL